MSKVVTEKEVPEKTVKVKARVIVTETIICDVDDCGSEVIRRGYTQSGGECSLCHRDVCYKHKTEENREGDDYWDTYCTICYELWEPARDEQEKRHEEERIALEVSVVHESLTRSLRDNFPEERGK